MPPLLAFQVLLFIYGVFSLGKILKNQGRDKSKDFAKVGDFFMHHEPGGAFFPMDENTARNINLLEIDLGLGELLLSAKPGQNDSDYIKNYAKRVDDFPSEEFKQLNSTYQNGLEAIPKTKLSKAKTKSDVQELPKQSKFSLFLWIKALVKRIFHRPLLNPNSKRNLGKAAE